MKRTQYIDQARQVGGEGLLHSGKFFQAQTFVKMPPEAPEEIFAVLNYCNKALQNMVPVKTFSRSFFFYNRWIIRENRKSLHHVKISLYTVLKNRCMHITKILAFLE